MVQEGAKNKKKNKNKNKKNKNQSPSGQPDDQVAQQQPAPPAGSGQALAENDQPALLRPLTNGFKQNSNAALDGLAFEASHWMNYNLSAIQEAESKYQIYLASNNKVSL